MADNSKLTITLTDEEKKKFIEIIKNINIEELNIPDDEAKPGTKRKWFKFGAYDSLRILSEEILNNGKTK